MAKVLIEDMRALNYCSRGGREWFQKNGLDWGDFIRNGIDSDVLRSFDNELVDRVCQVAEDRENGRR